MADKFSKGSNSSTFKNLWIDIGVIGMQGKGTETRKTVILTKKKKKKEKKNTHTHKKKKKNTIKSYLKKKRFYNNS